MATLAWQALQMNIVDHDWHKGSDPRSVRSGTEEDEKYSFVDPVTNKVTRLTAGELEFKRQACYLLLACTVPENEADYAKKILAQLHAQVPGF